jgi:hypothetical protein
MKQLLEVAKVNVPAPQLNCCGDETVAGGGTVNVRALQLNCCGDETVGGGGTVNLRALQLNSSLYWQLFYF